ncbi:hypothetical protein [Alteromonas antoniana]|jgi:hypothetical protein|uniref:hypothetical protein n=1 Tax=Alteromonas antoniana TaxID=2803813 RepID=UPI001C45DEFB|nr:hypothetical protein [Alteromonas antoniana]
MSLDVKIAKLILKESGISPSKLGLRFDRVVLRVLGDIRTFTESEIECGQTILLVVSAPIFKPVKTIEGIKIEITNILNDNNYGQQCIKAIEGNQINLRLVQSNGRHKFIGFVQNIDQCSQNLMDLAEKWIRLDA